MRLADFLVFLPEPPPSSLLFVGHYDPLLVLASLAIAVLAAYAALDVAERVRTSETLVHRLLWLALGALALGGGIWAMHFIGMLAWQLPCRVAYDAGLTYWSMLPGVLASAVAIEVIQRRQPGQWRLAAGSLLLGAGIGTMHYTGMAALRIDGLVRYSPQLFGLSILVAVLLAFLALQIRYRIGRRRWRIPLAALVMGGAVAGMHYTAMAATYFLRSGDARMPDSVFQPALLATIVGIFTILLIALVLVASFASRNQETAQRWRASEARLRNILETTQEGFIQIDPARRIVEANPALCRLLGRSHAEVVGQPVEAFLTAEGRATLATEMAHRVAGQSSNYMIDFRRPDGSLRHCRISGTPIHAPDGELLGAFALIHDETERMAHEAYVRHAVAVFENTSEGVMTTDAEGRILRVNAAFERITGYAAAEVLGHPPSVLRSGRHDREFYQRMWRSIRSAGHWQGEIWNRRKNGEIYPEWLSISSVRDAAGQVGNYVGVFSDISDIKRSAQELERLAHYDPLTDLANRFLLGVQLQHALERAARHNDKLVVMEIDLDGFKSVNDTLGHPAGDQLLRIVAQRLKSTLRSEDIVARLGGDEFAVVVEACREAAEASRVAEKLIAVIAEPMQIDGTTASVTSSIGLAVYPTDGSDTTALLRAADTALYVGKREGRNTFRFYDPGMSAAVRQRHELEQGLRLAIERGELELWYQPQIDVAACQVAGAEALVRWRHPQRGLIPPDDFLGVARDTGLIVSLGEWVLKTACQQAQTWRQAGIDIGRIAVNVDGLQIMRSDFVATVEAVLKQTGLPAEALELEITESFLLENADNGLGVVARFSRLGVSTAIDDFGTGYSSLSYLKYLHADCLKIDKSFVSGLPEDSDGAAIVDAVGRLGRGLGFLLVAEGVETQSQLAFLRTFGCDVMQGYLFARPMPASEFAAWLAAAPYRTLLAA